MGYTLTDSTEEAKVKEVIDRKITNKVGRFSPEELIGLMNFIDFYTMQSG